MSPSVRLLACAGLLASTTAHAACGPATVLKGPTPASQLRALGLSAAIVGQTLSVWPDNQRWDLNREYGAEVVFADRSSCVLPLPAGSGRGVAIPLGTGRAATIDVAVCDEVNGECLPVHLELPR